MMFNLRLPKKKHFLCWHLSDPTDVVHLKCWTQRGARSDAEDIHFPFSGSTYVIVQEKTEEEIFLWKMSQ